MREENAFERRKEKEGAQKKTAQKTGIQKKTTQRAGVEGSGLTISVKNGKFH